MAKIYFSHFSFLSESNIRSLLTLHVHMCGVFYSTYNTVNPLGASISNLAYIANRRRMYFRSWSTQASRPGWHLSSCWVEWSCQSTVCHTCNRNMLTVHSFLCMLFTCWGANNFGSCCHVCHRYRVILRYLVISCGCSCCLVSCFSWVWTIIFIVTVLNNWSFVG